MTEILAGWYPWLLGLHIIAVIAWMAGMLYLPRLFVYHAGTMPGSESSELFKIMERRLLKAIINPAMIAALILGILLLWSRDWVQLREGWMHGKLLALFFMFGVHGVLSGHTRRFAEDQRAKTARYYRVLNEIPTVLMVSIVLLVVVGTRI